MASNETTSYVVKHTVDELFDQLDSASVSTLEHFAQLQENRAARLAAVEARLKISLGEDHPRVVALRQTSSLADATKVVLRTTATRTARRPKIGPHEWMVFGEVRDMEEEPVPGVRVRVFDRDRKYDDLLGDTETDEYGDFAVVYHERDFAEVREQLPELYVMVQDAEGKLLFSSKDHVRHNPGRIEFFEIVLSEKLASEDLATGNQQAVKVARSRARQKAPGQQPMPTKRRSRKSSA